MQAWKRVEPTKALKVGHRTVVTKTFLMPDGREEQFDTINQEGFARVAIVAITPAKRVLVFRQFRPGPETIMDEAPGGGVEPGEDVKAAALREFNEETGYEFGEMLYLGKCSYDAYTNGWCHAFLALDCVPTKNGHNREPNEQDGELHEITIDAFIANSREGRMTDPGAVLLAYDHLLKLKE